MKHFVIIGMDDSKAPAFPTEVLKEIRAAHFFSGGLRHRELVAPLLPYHAEWIPVTAPLESVFIYYDAIFKEAAKHGKPTAIILFTSGDPLFFGLANTVKRRLPDADLVIYPTFHSLQLLAHRFALPYGDMRAVSLTGRPWQAFDRALMERTPKIGILTDATHTPAAIAARMIDYGYTYYAMYVGEHLGDPDRERTMQLTLKEAAKTTFQRPNCVLLFATVSTLPPRPFGIPDESFALLNSRPRMITKAPVRLLTLQALELSRRRVFWDIGFCTGSVSIEARLQFPHLTVVAFEIRPEGEALMRANSRRFGTPGIETVMGDFLDADTASLPRPDAVFIGGHGGHLAEIISKATALMQPGGCVVFNAVTQSGKAAFLERAVACGLRVMPPVRVAIDNYNPIDIMKALL